MHAPDGAAGEAVDKADPQEREEEKEERVKKCPRKGLWIDKVSQRSADETHGLDSSTGARERQRRAERKKDLRTAFCACKTSPLS